MGDASDDRAPHTHGIKVVGCTLTPSGNSTEAGARRFRAALNAFIGTGGAFDAVIDFDAVERDPNDPRNFRPGFNDGDRLHPNDAGYKAMSDAIGLKIFTKKERRSALRQRAQRRTFVPFVIRPEPKT